MILITIKGVTPLLALAFLADIGDITRFSSVRKFNSYLGVVPTVRSSGGKTIFGHTNKHSRKLARWRRDSNPGNPNPFLERQRLEELRRAVAKIEETRNQDN
jgi:transposase